MKKHRVRKLIIIFFALMAAFTLISRVIYQVCTPSVEIMQAYPGEIKKQMEVSGMVEGKSEAAFVSREGLRIREVNVHEGEYVKKGDVLYIYDTGDVLQQIEKKKESLKMIDYQIKEAKQAKVFSPSSTQTEQLAITRKQEENELSELEQILNRKGKVRADVNGYVKSVFAEPGSRTTGEADLILTKEDGKLTAGFVLDEEKKENLSVGKKVTVYRAQGENEKGEGTILSIQKNAETGEWEAAADLSGLPFEIGDTVTARVVDETRFYSCLIPREALHYGNGGKYFVYTVEDTETIMGMEKHAAVWEVEVLDMDEVNAALKQLPTPDPVIVDSDKQLADGGRIRFAKEVQ